MVTIARFADMLKRPLRNMILAEGEERMEELPKKYRCDEHGELDPCQVYRKKVPPFTGEMKPFCTFCNREVRSWVKNE